MVSAVVVADSIPAAGDICVMNTDVCHESECFLCILSIYLAQKLDGAVCFVQEYLFIIIKYLF